MGCRGRRGAAGLAQGAGAGARLTFVLPPQWQQTVHRYLSVRQSRMMKRPPKKVTMEEARKAHHMRWPRLSHGTSMVTGMMSASILGSWTEDEEEEEEDEEEEEEEDASRLRWFAWILLLILRLPPPPPPPPLPPPPPFAIASNARPAQGLGGAPPAASATPNTHQQPYCCYCCRRRGARGGGRGGAWARGAVRDLAGCAEIYTASRRRPPSPRPPARPPGGEGDGARGQLPSLARAPLAPGCAGP